MQFDFVKGEGRRHEILTYVCVRPGFLTGGNETKNRIRKPSFFGCHCTQRVFLIKRRLLC